MGQQADDDDAEKPPRRRKWRKADELLVVLMTDDGVVFEYNSPALEQLREERSGQALYDMGSNMQIAFMMFLEALYGGKQ